MATVIAQRLTYEGLTPIYNAADVADDKVKAEDGLFIIVKNGGIAEITVTFHTPGTVAGLEISDPTLVVPPGEERYFGPLFRRVFGDQTDNYLALIQWSDVTDVTFAAIRL